MTEFTLSGTEFPPYVVITLADIEYFSLPADQRSGHYCEVVALFNGSNASFPGYTPGSTTGDLWDPHGPAVDLWGAWTGDLSVLDLADETRSLCVDLDPAVRDGGTPMTTFDGMRFGAGIGELTDYSASGWTSETIDVFGESMMTQFIAIQRADGDFHAYDWNSAFLWEMDATGEVTVEAGQLVPEPVRAGTATGYMAGASFWYDDLVNLDLGALD